MTSEQQNQAEMQALLTRFLFGTTVTAHLPPEAHTVAAPVGQPLSISMT